MTLLITGGTGTVGRPTVEALRAKGAEPRILSRRTGPDHVVGDLRSGADLTRALDSARTVIHLATNRRNDLAATTRLVDAARRAGVEHLMYLSIVGVDAVPLGYYRAKLRCEEAIARSGLQCTILRATQFHDFVAGAFRAQQRMPRVVTVDVPFQPIEPAAVASRLVELVSAGPADGRVDDLGGPEVLPMRELATQWLVAGGVPAHDAERRTVTLRAPGRIVGAYRAGRHTTGAPGPGRTFSEWAADQA